MRPTIVKSDDQRMSVSVAACPRNHAFAILRSRRCFDFDNVTSRAEPSFGVLSTAFATKYENIRRIWLGEPPANCLILLKRRRPSGPTKSRSARDMAS